MSLSTPSHPSFLTVLLSLASIPACLASPAQGLSTFETTIGGWSPAGDVCQAEPAFDPGTLQGDWALLLTTFPGDPTDIGPLSGQPNERRAVVSASVLEALLDLSADLLDARLPLDDRDAIEGSATQDALLPVSLGLRRVSRSGDRPG